MKKLTRKEKIQLNIGKDKWRTHDLDGTLTSVVMSDGPIGLRTHRQDKEESTIPSVAYPCAQILSQTWDVKMVEKYAYALADDCIERNVDVLLGPGVTIKRSPVCGRNFEYMSEDPYLAGIMGYTYIQSLQSRHVGACLKHYCCNNQENERFWLSSDVDEQTLRNIYLKPFEIACRAKPYTIMSSYNRVNGIQVNEHKELHRILREDLGFDGLVMSDWWAVRNPAAAINAGTNVIMPYTEETYQEALASDEIDEKALDENNRRLFALCEKVEKDRPFRKVQTSVEERLAIAREVAENGIVLLKNNGVLPIKNKEKEIPVMGKAAEQYYRGGGSSAVVPLRPYQKLDEALREAGVNARFAWDKRTGTLRNCVKLAETSDLVLVAVGNPETVETEELDREHIRLSAEEEFYIHTLSKVNKNVVVLIYAGSAIDMSGWIDEVSAVVWVGYSGERANAALARILTGEVNPSGKLTETFPLKLEDIPAIGTYRDAEKVKYSEGEMVGYRYFTSTGKEVLFPFGYGLSYSTFEYADLSVIEEKGEIVAEFTLRNTSSIDGKEVAQVYLSRKNNGMRELKGFAKREIKAGQSERIRISFSKENLQGEMELWVGGNSRDVIEKAALSL